MLLLIKSRLVQWILSWSSMLVFFVSSSAGAAQPANVSQFFPFTPRLSFSANPLNFSDQQNLDGMLPLWGNARGHFYAAMEVQHCNDDSWYGSLGVGERQIINPHLLIGIYGFLDHSQTLNDTTASRWQIFNPGIEWMTPQWDGRINVYLPMGSDRKYLPPRFGDQLGLPHHVFFHQHQQYGELFYPAIFIGKGEDIDIGRTFSRLHRLRLHAGSYFFHLPEGADNRYGVEAGAELPLHTHLTLGLDAAHDNIQGNNIFFTIKLVLGGIHPSPAFSLQDRLMDPVYRHLGTHYLSGEIFTGSKLITSRKQYLEKNNVWFFNAQSGKAFNPPQGNDNCTFEHPCHGIDFNQSTVDEINRISPGTNFYLTPGTYTIQPSLLLNASQSLYGRSTDYQSDASLKTGLPALIGSLKPQGNNILDSFQILNNNGLQPAGIAITDANNITLRHVWIGEADAQKGFPTAIALDNAQNILIENSTLNAAGVKDVYGIRLRNSHPGLTSLTANNNTVNVNSRGKYGNVIGLYNSPGNGEISVNASGNTFNIHGGGDFLAGVSNMLFENGSVIANINHNKFNIYSQGNEDFSIGINSMVFSSGTLTVNAQNNNFMLTANGSEGLASGIHSEAMEGGRITLDVSHNNVDITGNNLNTMGIDTLAFAGGAITINADYNTFHLHASEPNAFIYGIKTFDPEGKTTITISNNIFHLTTPDPSQEIEIDNKNGGTINDLGGNKFYHH